MNTENETNTAQVKRGPGRPSTVHRKIYLVPGEVNGIQTLVPRGKGKPSKNAVFTEVEVMRVVKSNQYQHNVTPTFGEAREITLAQLRAEKVAAKQKINVIEPEQTNTADVVVNQTFPVNTEAVPA